MEFSEKARKEILNHIYAPGGPCTNLSGSNPFGDVDENDANDIQEVKQTKQGAAMSTYESFFTSFYSSHILAKSRHKMASLFRISEDAAEDESDYEKEPSFSTYSN